MKRIILSFVLVAAMLTVGNAQQSSGLEVSLSSGFVFPSSPMTFADYWKMQYGGGISVGMDLSESMTLLGAFEYYRFTLNKDGISKGFDTPYMRDIWIFNDVSSNPSADPSSVMTGSANVRVSPLKTSGMLSPYFVAGAGVMRFSLSEIALPMTSVLSINGSDISMTAQRRITGGDNTSAFFQFGMGIDFRLTQTILMFVEGRYTSGLNKGLGTTYLPITAGMKLRL
jgi:opacity protein-like surface antigen